MTALDVEVLIGLAAEDTDGTRQLESAERALAGALAQTDIRKAAALLRCAAKYLEGAAAAGERTRGGLTRIGPGGRPRA